MRNMSRAPWMVLAWVQNSMGLSSVGSRRRPVLPKCMKYEPVDGKRMEGDDQNLKRCKKIPSAPLGSLLAKPSL